MTTILERWCRALAVAAFLVLAPPASIAAEDAPAPDAGLAEAQALFDAGRFGEALAVLRPLASGREISADVGFLLGLAAIETSRHLRDATEAERKALLDEAVALLHAMLVQRPELVRVRLELARAFFYKGEDSLARDHFERVLAGELPASVKGNVRRFLSQIRARRRWTAYLGVSIAPDTNIGGASDEEFIYLLDVPFLRDNADDLITSGVGVSVWTGGEYQHPVGNRLRLRAGADLARREYAGGEFDETNVAVHAGPRWLIDRRTEASLLANVRRRWAAGEIDFDAPGARLQARRRLTARVSGNVRASWERRLYRERDHLDGPVFDVLLGGTWTIAPILRANASFGYSRERPETLRHRNDSRRVRAGLSAILPRGFNMRASAQIRWTDYDGNWGFFTGSSSTPREDRTDTLSLSLHKRDFTLFGFAPQLVVTHEERDSTAQLHDYNRTRAEIRFVHQF